MNSGKQMAALLTTTCLLLYSTGSYGQRVLPDTTGQLMVWADQLATSSPGQDQFVGENFIGSQKLTKNRIDPIRAHNPNFLVLQYHKAYGVDIGNNITDENTWSSDIEQLRAWILVEGTPDYGVTEDDLYLYWEDTHGSHRIAHSWENQLEYHLADIRQLAYKNYVVDETIRRAEVVGFDGTFFDVAHFPWFGYDPSDWFTNPPWNWPWPPNGSQNPAANWNDLARPYWQYIHWWYHLVGNYLAIANVGRMIDGWYEYTFLDDIDGGMSESWMTEPGSDTPLNAGDWELSASRILRYLTGNNKVLIAQPNSDSAGDLALRRWWVANYFLLKGSKSYYYYDMGQQVAWWPEYDITLGAYTQNPPTQLDTLLVPGTTSLYRRTYEMGMVLVNPGDTAQSYTLDGNYCQYSFSGGGFLVGTTQPPMTLNCTGSFSGTISIAAHDALILFRPGSATGNQNLLLYLPAIMSKGQKKR